MPFFTATREKVGPFLDALAADHLRADEAQCARLGEELDPDLFHVRVVARAGDADRLTDDVGDAEGGRRDLPEGDAADHPLAGDHAPRHIDRLVRAVSAARVGASDLALGVGVAAGQALQRQTADAMGHLAYVAGRPHVRGGGAHVVVDDERRRSNRP